MNHLPEHRPRTISWFIAFIIIGFLVCAFLLIFLGKNVEGKQREALTENFEALSAQVPNTTPYVIDSPLNVRARSVLVMDFRGENIMYEKKAREPYPLASLTKNMTAIAAEELLPSDTVIAFFPDAQDRQNNPGIRMGDTWELSKLLQFMLISSSNAAASQIAAEAEKKNNISFIAYMNSRAQELGASSLVFHSTTGLDDQSDGESTAEGNAYDVMKILSYGTEKYPSIFKYTSEPSRVLNHVRAENTNILAAKIPGLISSKTGYTQSADGNLAFIFEPIPEHPIGVVILGSTFYGRFEDAKKVIDAIQDSFARS